MGLRFKLTIATKQKSKKLAAKKAAKRVKQGKVVLMPWNKKQMAKGAQQKKFEQKVTSVVAPVAKGQVVQRSKVSRCARVVERSEFLSSVVQPVTSPLGQFTPTSFNINPGLATTFPLLWQEAQLYQEYECDYINFEYQSQTNTGNNGDLYMATQINPDAPVYTSVAGMVDADYSTNSNIWNSFWHKPNINEARTKRRFFVRNNTPATGIDLANYDIGILTFATQGVTTTNSTIGLIIVHYKFRFYRPTLPALLVAPYGTNYYWSPVAATVILDGASVAWPLSSDTNINYTQDYSPRAMTNRQGSNSYRWIMDPSDTGILTDGAWLFAYPGLYGIVYNIPYTILVGVAAGAADAYYTPNPLPVGVTLIQATHGIRKTAALTGFVAGTTVIQTSAPNTLVIFQVANFLGNTMTIGASSCLVEFGTLNPLLYSTNLVTWSQKMPQLVGPHRLEKKQLEDKYEML